MKKESIIKVTFSSVKEVEDYLLFIENGKFLNHANMNNECITDGDVYFESDSILYPIKLAGLSRAYIDFYDSDRYIDEEDLSHIFALEPTNKMK